jgi:hypothetical protein
MSANRKISPVDLAVAPEHVLRGIECDIVAGHAQSCMVIKAIRDAHPTIDWTTINRVVGFGLVHLVRIILGEMKDVIVHSGHGDLYCKATMADRAVLTHDTDLFLYVHYHVSPATPDAYTNAIMLCDIDMLNAIHAAHVPYHLERIRQRACPDGRSSVAPAVVHWLQQHHLVVPGPRVIPNPDK